MHYRNDNFTLAIVGKTGSGKTYAAIELCDLMDRKPNGDYNFTADKIAFDVQSFLNIIKNAKRYEFNLFDEAGIAINSRAALTHQNRVMSEVNQSFRSKNLGTIYCFPGSLSFVDKQVRMLFKFEMRMRKIHFSDKKSEASFYELESMPGFAEPWTIRPSFTDKNGNYRVWNTIMLSKPRSELVKNYEEKKKEFLEKLDAVHEAKMGGRSLNNIYDIQMDEYYKQIKENPTPFLSKNKNQLGMFTKISVLAGFEASGASKRVTLKTCKELAERLEKERLQQEYENLI